MTTRKTAGAASAPATSKKPTEKKPSVKRAPRKKSTPAKTEEKIVQDNTPAETKEEINATGTAPAPGDVKTQTEVTTEEVISEMPKSIGICVVIPYVDKLAAGEELLFAIRAWQKHLPELGVIVVVGDSLPWFGKDIVHIPHKRASINPQIDVAAKLATVIASDKVDDTFVWTNDDIIPVSRVYPEDLLVRKAMGPLREKGTAGTDYRENSIRTIAALANRGITKGYDFAAHMPVVFEKEKLAETLAEFACQKEGKLISTLYFNTHYKEDRPILIKDDATGSVMAAVRSSNPQPTILARVFKERKFINFTNKGWPNVKPYLEKLFPEKSPLEK